MVDTYVDLQPLFGGSVKTGSDTYVDLNANAFVSGFSLSQNAGKAAGSSVVLVTNGNGFAAGMTSTLGTVSSITPTTCTITTNAHAAGVFNFTITTANGVSPPQPFTYLAVPTTPTISPDIGPWYSTQTVTVTTANLPFALTCPYSITVDGYDISASIGTSTTASGIVPIQCTVGAGDVVVTVDGVTATASGIYTVSQLPTIVSTSVSTGSSNGDTQIFVTGTNFIVGPGSNTTSNLGQVAGGSLITATSCYIITNSGSVGTFDWYISTVHGNSTPDQVWTYVHSPTLTALSQNAATISGGTSITCTGTGYTDVVDMGCTIGTVTSVPLSTSCLISTHSQTAGSHNLALTTALGASDVIAVKFLAAPGTPSISPNSGNNGSAQAVTITTTNLPYSYTCPVSVTVGGLTLTSPTVVSATSFTGTIPSGHAAGTADVVVTVDGISTTLTNGYTFETALPPTVSLVYPLMANTNGGSVINLTGTNFIAGMTCTVAGNTVSATINSSTSASFFCPANIAYANGSGATALTITVTTVVGSDTSHSLYYIPDAYTLLLSGDVGITSSGGVISQWADQSSTGALFTDANSLFPTVLSNFNGTGIPAIALNGQQNLYCATTPAVITLGAYTEFIVHQFSSIAGTPFMILEEDNGTTVLDVFDGNEFYEFYDANISIQYIGNIAPDTNAHILSIRNLGAGNTSSTAIDNVNSGTWTTMIGSRSVSMSLGSRQTISGGSWDGVNGSIAAVLFYPSDIGTTAYNNVVATLMAIFGIP